MPLPLDIQRISVPGGHGADDYESDAGEAYVLVALSGGTPVGTLTYNLLDGGED